MIWNEKIHIEDSFVGRKVLEMINNAETNEFTKVHIERTEN